MFLRITLWALVLSVTQLAYGQYQPEMTMHRIQAGELDATGWTTAQSTEGRFTVRLPLRFNDFTVAETDPNSVAAKTFAVGAKSAEGIKFSATRVTYRKPGAAANRFSQIENGEAFPTKPTSIKKIQHRGFKAVDVTLSNSSSVAYQRVLLVGPDIVTLIVEAPLPQRDLAMRLVPTFFESVTIEPQ